MSEGKRGAASVPACAGVQGCPPAPAVLPPVRPRKAGRSAAPGAAARGVGRAPLPPCPCVPGCCPPFTNVYAAFYISICTCTAGFPFVNLLVFTFVNPIPCWLPPRLP